MIIPIYFYLTLQRYDKKAIQASSKTEKSPLLLNPGENRILE
jgi:hypothetical protein